MNTKLTPSKSRSRKPELPANPYITVEIDAYKELLRQAQQMFNVHLFAMIIAIFVTAAGCFLIFSGNPTEGAVSAISGVGAGAYFSKLARISNSESSRKLKELVKEVKALR